MFEPCAEIGRVAFQWLPRNVFSDVTRNYRCYLLHRARFCYDDLQELFSFTTLNGPAPERGDFYCPFLSVAGLLITSTASPSCG
jgi:hypothetical protein